MEKIAVQVESIKWLYDMEMIDHPQLINHLKLNIYTLTKNIKNVELLFLQEQKSMVIYYELGFFDRILGGYKDNNLIITDLIGQLLPNFRLRIVNDKKLFDLILKTAKEAIHGKIFYSDFPVDVNHSNIRSKSTNKKSSGSNSKP